MFSRVVWALFLSAAVSAEQAETRKAAFPSGILSGFRAQSATPAPSAAPTTAAPTASPKPSWTPTSSPKPSPYPSHNPTVTPPSAAPTESPKPSPSPSLAPTKSKMPTPKPTFGTPTASPAPTTPSASPTESPAPSPAPSESPTIPLPSVTPTTSPAPSPAPTGITPTTFPTVSPAPSTSPTASPAPSPNPTASPSVTVSEKPSSSPAPSMSPTGSPKPSPSPSMSPSATLGPTLSSNVPSTTPTVSNEPSVSLLPSISSQPSISPSESLFPSVSSVPSVTPSASDEPSVSSLPTVFEAPVAVVGTTTTVPVPASPTPVPVTLPNVGTVLVSPSPTPVTVTVTAGDISASPVVPFVTESNVLFSVAEQLTYEATITLTAQPTADSVEFVMDVPQSFRNMIDSGTTIEAFALVQQTAGTGADPFVVFDLIPSVFDATANTVTMQIPRAAFTEISPAGSTGNFAAVVTLASTPGTARRRLLRRELQASCAVTPFNCPLAGLDCVDLDPLNKFVRGGGGNQYYAVDFNVPAGTDVIAAADGTVAETGTSDSWGTYVIIRHNSDGASTVYGFLQSTDNSLATNAPVTVGQTIGVSGQSGPATMDALHFELVPSGKTAATKERVDPFPCINALPSDAPSQSPSQSLMPSESNAPSMA